MVDTWQPSPTPIYMYIQPYIPQLVHFYSILEREGESFREREEEGRRRGRNHDHPSLMLVIFELLHPPIPLYTHPFHYGEFIVVKISLGEEGSSPIGKEEEREE